MTAAAETRTPHLIFSVGPSWYAVPSDSAAEVVSFGELTRVPGAPPHLLGVFAHRGEVIPVVDLSLLIGSAEERSRRAVLVRVDKGAIALTAGKVAGVSQVSGGLEPLGTEGIQQHLRGPAKADKADVAVVDPDGLFEFLSQGN